MKENNPKPNSGFLSVMGLSVIFIFPLNFSILKFSSVYTYCFCNQKVNSSMKNDQCKDGLQIGKKKKNKLF